MYLPQHTMAENIPPLGYKHLTNIDIAKCLILNKNDWTQQEITNEIGYKQSIIQYVLKKYFYETFIKHK